MEQQYIMLIMIVVVFGGMMWWQPKKAKQQQQEKQDFRRDLQSGTEVIIIGQAVGKVAEVDKQYEEIVIDSEGSKLRFGFSTITREYTRPAYVSDDEVDENGNSLPDEDAEAPANDEAGQALIEASVVSEENTADETGDGNETKTE